MPKSHLMLWDGESLLHIIFGNKMEEFYQKSEIVAGGHKTDLPVIITFASAVSRERLHIELPIVPWMHCE